MRCRCRRRRRAGPVEALLTVVLRIEAGAADDARALVGRRRVGGGCRRRCLLCRCRWSRGRSSPRHGDGWPRLGRSIGVTDLRDVVDPDDESDHDESADDGERDPGLGPGGSLGRPPKPGRRGDLRCGGSSSASSSAMSSPSKGWSCRPMRRSAARAALSAAARASEPTRSPRTRNPAAATPAKPARCAPEAPLVARPRPRQPRHRPRPRRSWGRPRPTRSPRPPGRSRILASTAGRTGIEVGARPPSAGPYLGAIPGVTPVGAMSEAGR